MLKYRLYIGLLIALLVWGCKNDLSRISLIEDYSQKPQLSVEDFHSYYKSNSRLQMELRSKLMEKYSNRDYIVFPKGLDLTFYNENVDTTVNLVCEYAEHYASQKLWRFQKNVVVRSTDGGILKTQELYFDQQKELIYSLKIIELIDTLGNYIRGKGGFEANMNFTIFEFKNVDGLIRLPEENL